MLGGPQSRIFTFLSAAAEEEKGEMLVNLAASLSQSGSDVLLVDACHTARGIAAGLEASRSTSLLQSVRRQCSIDDVIQQMPQGFGVAALRPETERMAT